MRDSEMFEQVKTILKGSESDANAVKVACRIEHQSTRMTAFAMCSRRAHGERFDLVKSAFWRNIGKALEGDSYWLSQYEKMIESRDAGFFYP